MRTRNVIALVFGALLTTLTVRGQEPQEAANVESDTVFFFANGAAPVMPLGGAVDIIGSSGVIGETVTGKPYSAESVTESTQRLLDGNRITSTNRARFYRDSQGRTRREQTLGSVGVWQTTGNPVTMVTIADPVNDTMYFLDVNARTAREITRFKLESMDDAVSGSHEAVQEWVGAVPATAGIRVATPGGAEVADLETFEVAVPPPHVMPLPARAGRGAIGGTIAFGAISAFDASQSTTEDLGEQILEGVLARGTRQTNTIPAGAIGNELPIQMVHEQWYSEDIEAVILRRDIDPRFGETSYRLINVDRSEPSPDLFTLPQDYEVIEQTHTGPALMHMQRFDGEPAAAGADAVPGPGQRIERRVFVVQPDPAQASPSARSGE